MVLSGGLRPRAGKRQPLARRAFSTLGSIGEYALDALENDHDWTIVTAAARPERIRRNYAPAANDLVLEYMYNQGTNTYAQDSQDGVWKWAREVTVTAADLAQDPEYLLYQHDDDYKADNSGAARLR